MTEDHAKVDPGHYKVELENDQVRALRIRYGPRGKSVMHGHLGRVSLLIATLLCALGLFPSVADAYLTHLGVPPNAIVALTGAVAPGTTTDLILVGGSQGFIVPSGKVLVLTDIVFSPQVFPPTGEYEFQVIPSPQFFTTALSVTSTATDPSSFQVHLTGGMVFHAGSNVRVSLVFGSAPVNISAFGYLVNALSNRAGGQD